MYVDDKLIVSGGVSAAGAVTFQTVTGSSAVKSTNCVDLGTNRDVGEGEDLYARILVGTAFAGLTGLDIEAVIADDATLTNNVVTVGAMTYVPVADLTAGARIAFKLSPLLNKKGQRYLGLLYTPSGTGTAGTLFADFGLEVQDSSSKKGYASGFSIK